MKIETSNTNELIEYYTNQENYLKALLQARHRGIVPRPYMNMEIRKTIETIRILQGN